MIDYSVGHATAEQIAVHLNAVSSDFVPPLDSRVDIPVYATKLALRAVHVEAWSDDRLVGIVAGYCSDKSSVAFVSNVSVLRDFLRQGIARRLLAQFVGIARDLGMKSVALEVSEGNTAAINLYEAAGFSSVGQEGDLVTMTMSLGREK